METKQIIEKTTYMPIVSSLKENLGLGNFIRFNTNKENLMYDLSGVGSYKDQKSQQTKLNNVVGTYVLDQLNKQMTNNGKVNLKLAQDIVEKGLVKKIENSAFVFTKEKENILLGMLPTQRKHMQKVFELRYGLNGNDEHTFKEVGGGIGRSHDRGRQILVNGLRSLRHPSKLGGENGFNIMYGTHDEVQKYLKQVEIEGIKDELRVQMYDEVRETVMAQLSSDTALVNSLLSQNEEFKSDLMNQSVQDLDLSVRAANCFINANIETIGDLTTKNMHELLKIKNFGRKNLNEIRNLLTSMGLTLKGERLKL